jgi:hypothetical protein
MAEVITFTTDDGKTIEIMRLDSVNFIYRGQILTTPQEAHEAIDELAGLMKEKAEKTLNSK